MISPEFDTYGKFARATLLADYCELLALAGHGPSRAQLANFIDTNDWDLRQLMLKTGQVRADVVAPDIDESADLVFDLLDTRARVLGGKYPFEIERGHVIFRAALQRQGNPYLAVLAISTVHAYGIACIVDPKKVFELTVIDALVSRGLMAAPIADLRRSRGTFDAALEAACQALGFVADPTAIARHRFAHDEGVDTVVHASWGDSRAGAFAWIGQVTCARSDDWETKIMEPAPRAWVHFLGVRAPPVAFLAVPHHAEPAITDQLLDFRERPLLDRLRIVLAKERNSADEEAVVGAMLAEDVEPL